MSGRVGDTLVEPRRPAPDTDVVDGETAGPEPRPRTIASGAPAEESRVTVIVEHSRSARNEPHPRGVPRPRPSRRDSANAVETAPYVQPFGGRDQPAGAKGHLVPAEAQRQRSAIARAPFHVEKRLMHVECVLVGRPGSADPARLETTLNLDEGTGTRAEVPVGVQQVSLQQVARWIVGLRSKAWLTHLLIAPTPLAADGKVPVVAFEWHVLDAVPHVSASQRVLQDAPVFVVAILLVLGPRVAIGRCGLRLCAPRAPQRRRQRPCERTHGGHPMRSPCRDSGSERYRRPVARKIAFVRAGTTVTGPTSPIPPNGRAPISMKYTSTGGISGMRRTWKSCQLLSTVRPPANVISERNA